MIPLYRLQSEHIFSSGNVSELQDEVPILDLDWDINYPDWVVLMVFISPSREIP
jgi:hypothetical protein